MSIAALNPVLSAALGRPPISRPGSAAQASELSPSTQRTASGQDGQPSSTQPSSTQSNADGDTFTPSGQKLSDDEQRQVDELAARDREVRTHEEAHVAAAGALFRGGPNYEYQKGPDGKRYAVGGNVKIDTSEGRTPEETIQKAQQIQRAALAPAEPSSTDRAVAAKASRMESEARQELTEQQAAEQAGRTEQAEQADAFAFETANASGPSVSSAPQGFDGTLREHRLDLYA